MNNPFAKCVAPGIHESEYRCLVCNEIYSVNTEDEDNHVCKGKKKMDAVQEFMRAALEGVKKENEEKPSREGSMMFTKIEDAMVWRAHQQILKQKDRQRAG